MAETLMRLESFPFDSRFDGYDDYGYPVFDRAVGARMLRETFKEFFKNGVFPTPADALEISKGNGLSVNIKSGAFIINGAMGVITDDTNVVLADQPPRGIVTYGIMLRFDENTEFRSCYIRIAVGEAGGAIPVPQESVGVKEYRLGYITVPNGAQDLSGATVKNEKGLAVCPYAAPFEEIDVDSIVSDFRNEAEELLSTFDGELDMKNKNAQTALASLLSDFDRYRQLIESVLDGSTAGHLQNQIDSILEQLKGFDLSDSVDGVTIAFSRKPNDAKETLHIIDGGIKSEHLADSSVTSDKIANGSIHYADFSDEALDSIAANSILPITSDLTFAIYKLHLDALKNSDMDSVIVWEFDQDTTPEVGMWDDEGKKFYCYKGAE